MKDHFIILILIALIPFIPGANDDNGIHMDKTPGRGRVREGGYPCALAGGARWGGVQLGMGALNYIKHWNKAP